MLQWLYFEVDLFDWATYMFGNLMFNILSFISTAILIWYITKEFNRVLKLRRVMKKYVMTMKEILSWIPNKIFILSDKYLNKRFTRKRLKTRKGSSR